MVFVTVNIIGVSKMDGVLIGQISFRQSRYVWAICFRIFLHRGTTGNNLDVLNTPGGDSLEEYVAICQRINHPAEFSTW